MAFAELYKVVAEDEVGVIIILFQRKVSGSSKWFIEIEVRINLGISERAILFVQQVYKVQSIQHKLNFCLGISDSFLTSHFLSRWLTKNNLDFEHICAACQQTNERASKRKNNLFKSHRLIFNINPRKVQDKWYSQKLFQVSLQLL